MMNRDMRKLRKDPTIPPSAATVITSTTNAFPESPRMGNTSTESRGSSRNRTSPKSHGTGMGATGLDSGSGASSISSATPLNTTITSTSGSNISSTALSSATIGGPNFILPGGVGGVGIGGVTPGSILGYGNGHAYKTLSGNSASSGTSRHIKKISNIGPQSFKFDTNGAISALAASPDFSMVAVNGRDVLKILSVTDNSAEEKTILKTTGGRSNFGGSTIDVKWGPVNGRDAKIATLGTNGPIVIWDIGTHNKIDRVLKEHTRQVNRICFSPQDPNLLLSGASDNTMRLWDLRIRDRQGIILDAKDTVREVQFNPLNVNEIAAGYESGNIQRWDLRNLGTIEKKFMAHMGFVTSLDYHPNGRFLATGGRDKTIKVWDMEDEKRREMYTIPTIQFTCKVQWRPNRPYQLAACFKDESTVQIFDVRRPFVPQHVLTHHDKNVAALLWRDTDVLFTVSNDKTFASTLIKGQPFSEDLLPSGNATMNCYGQLAFTVSSKSNIDSFEKDLISKPGRPNVKPVALDGSSDTLPTFEKHVNIIQM
ncbi:WD repeat-containing protein 24 [Entomortierella beljakovae]|nr:WD repeat-containing protein 24 [Entomortierella beljakovae]